MYVVLLVLGLLLLLSMSFPSSQGKVREALALPGPILSAPTREILQCLMDPVLGPMFLYNKWHL